MSLFRHTIDRIAGYSPGEQPQDSGWIKLNTNENPYPPSPSVQEAILAASGRLRLYPDPLATRFRQTVARLFDLDPDWVLPANGSDENLTLVLRSFVDPQERVVSPYPSYILYETLAALQGAASVRLPLRADWTWDPNTAAALLASAKLVLIPNPNSPSGNLWSQNEVTSLVPPNGVLVLDEAYGDFAETSRPAAVLNSPEGRRIIITRTLSKSYSLAGIRLGFALAHPDLIHGMRKVKDSYNCDSLSLAAGIAALEDQAWMRANTSRICATRSRLQQALERLGFSVVPSQANFVWCAHPAVSSRTIYEALKSRHILVRSMTFPGVEHAPNGELAGLRISIGTDAEIDTLLDVLPVILSNAA